MFGLKVNFHKSKIGVVGISEWDLNFFSNCLNYAKTDFYSLIWMWLAFTKTIWMHRNMVIFVGGQVDEVEIFLQTQLQAWRWTRFGEIEFQRTYAK